MNPWFLHLYIAVLVYVVVATIVFSRLYYLAVRYKLVKSVVNWRRVVLIDSLLWPYYVFRYGVESFYKEIS